MLVPAERIELPTFALQMRCTTAVLRRRSEELVEPVGIEPTTYCLQSNCSPS